MEMNLEIAEAAGRRLGNPIGIQDDTGEQIRNGDMVELRIDSPHAKSTIIIRGRVEYRAGGVGTYGCGYAIVDSKDRIWYLSSLARYETNKLLIIREEQS